MPDPFAALRHELAVANRILANEGIIDAFDCRNVSGDEDKPNTQDNPPCYNQPPFRFQPSAGMIATPAYGRPAERPRFSTEPRRLYEPPKTPTADDELNMWLRVGAFFLASIAMMLVSSWLALGRWRRDKDKGGGRGQTPSVEH